MELRRFLTQRVGLFEMVKESVPREVVLLFSVSGGMLCATRKRSRDSVGHFTDIINTTYMDK